MKLPRLAPPHRPLLSALLARNGTLLQSASPTLPDGRYLHWDQLRHRPSPTGLTAEDWWAAMRFARERKARPVEAMTRAYGTSFSVVDLGSIQRALHEFDRANVGQTILSALGNPEAQVEYQVRQLIEEAISSSEIEGARPTT